MFALELVYASRRFRSPSCCHETCWRQVATGGVANAWKPALNNVWEFLNANPDLRSDGHNVFLDRHPERRDMPMDVDFGVEVSREFEPKGEVRAICAVPCEVSEPCRSLQLEERPIGGARPTPGLNAEPQVFVCEFSGFAG